MQFSTIIMDEKHVFGVSQTLAFVRWMSWLVAISLKPNVQRYGAWRLKEISRSVGDEVS